MGACRHSAPGSCRCSTEPHTSMRQASALVRCVLPMFPCTLLQHNSAAAAARKMATTTRRCRQRHQRSGKKSSALKAASPPFQGGQRLVHVLPVQVQCEGVLHSRIGGSVAGKSEPWH